MFGPAWDTCVINGVATLSCIFPLFQNIVMAAIMLSGVFAVFLIIFAGFKFIRSNGDPKQVDGARQIATYAILGIFLIMLSFLIIRVIAQITNVDCITEFGFDQCDPEGLNSGDPNTLPFCTNDIYIGPAPYSCTCSGGTGVNWKPDWEECDTNERQE